MMFSSLQLKLVVLIYWIPFSYGQIDTTQCDIAACCFRHPNGCSGTNCNILIVSRYNNTGILEVEIGTKESWVAFGLNSVPNKMDATAGEICHKSSPSPLLVGFKNDEYTPITSASVTGLTTKSIEVKNNFLVCRYSRPITPPGGTYMLDLNKKHYIVAAFGTSTFPNKHGNSQSATSSSPSSLDFSKPCSVTGTKASATNVIAHGCLMVIAWVCFASTGIFIARFARPFGGDQSCLGKRIWFQSHRIFMVSALLLTIIGIIIIFVHKKGWSQGAGAHPVLGLIVAVLAVAQPIMAALRPHPEEENRWLFNWTHRIVGLSAVILSAVTIILGLDLFETNKAVAITWIVIGIIFFIGMEVAVQIIGKSSSSAEFNSAKNTVGTEVLVTDTSLTFRKVGMLLAMVVFFALGFATVGLIAAKA